MIRKRLARAAPTHTTPIPFWKDKTFIMWAVPIIVPSASVIFDSEYLRYFDIPILFAEINLYIILFVFTAMILIVLGLSLALLAAQTLADSKYSFLRLLVQPVPFMLASVLALFHFFTDQSYGDAIALYSLMLIASLVFAYFEDNKNAFSKRVNSQYEFLAKGSKVINTPAGRIYERTATLVAYLFVALLAMLVSGYIASRYDIQVLKNEPNTIVIKRNNNVYILKKYDPLTNILEEGYRIASLDTENLELITIKNPIYLKSKFKAEYLSEEKERDEIAAKEIENIQNNLINNLGVLKSKIVNFFCNCTPEISE